MRRYSSLLNVSSLTVLLAAFVIAIAAIGASPLRGSVANLTGAATSPQLTGPPVPDPTTSLLGLGLLTSVHLEAGSLFNYLDTKGNLWIPDAFYTDGAGGGIIDRGPIPIAGTTDPKIFQTEHYCVDRYSVPVIDGTYTVNLLFAETDLAVTGPGQRVFDVNVGGQSVTNFDVYAQAGGSNIALVKTFKAVPVTGGNLTITFTRRTKCNIINGIEITANGPNQPPTVNAGPDQTTTLSASARLNGSASDDGLPLGSTLTITWSKVSGPGTVTFADASAPSTTASFSVAGRYVLRLMASDSELSSSDEVTVTVNSPLNQPPSVNAGPDQTITLPASAALNGTASDDGLPAGSTVTTTWSKITGPGSVTFADPSARSTTATFSVSGTYVLRLTASDSELSSTDEVTITVNQGPPQTSGIIDPSRMIPWQGNVGIVGGIPARTSVRDCVTDAYAVKGTFCRDLVNDDRQAIMACINSLSENQVAYLPAGNYRLNTTLDLSGKNNITVRGAGPGQTKLYFYGSGGYTYVEIGGSGVFDPPNYTASWTAGFTKGTTAVTLSAVGNLSVGSILALDQVDDNSSLAFSYGNEGSQYTRDGNTRHLTQFVSVTGINGNQVTISPPLYTNYSASQSPGAYWWASSIKGVGIEDLSVDPSNDVVPPNYSFDIQYAQNIWLKNVESYLAPRSHVHTFRAKSVEIRDSYFHHSRAYASVSYGVEMWYTSCALKENNIFDVLVAPMMVATGASGNVFGYNYIASVRYDTASTWLPESTSIHGGHGLMNLFEGNIVPNIYLDNIWGSNSHTTIFRNAISGWQADRSTNTFPIVLEAHSRYNNVVGNVLGKSGYHNVYEAYNRSYTGGTAIYVLGYWGTDRTNNVTNYDLTVYNTLLRHMNLDYATGSVKYCNSDGGPRCQSGDGSTTLPNSLYLPSKPAWYGGCAWPAINPVGPIVNNIPAKSRYEGQSCAPHSD